MEPIYNTVIIGQPVAQGRARSTLIKKKDGSQFISHYDPSNSRHYKELVRKRLVARGVPAVLIDEPVVLSCRVYIRKPQSKIFGPKSKKKEIIFPFSKPDLSNYIKGIEDSMEGLVVANDSIIVGYHDTWKIYTKRIERVEIKLYRAEDLWNGST